MLKGLFLLLIFPGLLFLFISGLAAEFIDRRLYARFQNRQGPPWFQPIADFIKLMGKEDIVPFDADRTMFRFMPILALASTVTAFFYIPQWRMKALYAFNGDVIVVLYLLTIPTLTYFLAGWYSRSVYSMIGAIRSLTQLFAYEVPLFLCILAAALLADTWSLSEMTKFYNAHPAYWILNIMGFGIAILTLLGKLEKVPFDIPEAETEIVAGSFTEYGGRLLAFFKATINIETVVGSSLLTAVFLPFWYVEPLVPAVLVYLIKVFAMIFVMSLARSVFARLRLDQMIDLCWKWLAPLAFLQVLINLIVKVYFLKG
jgi:NADH-quinone oxidoreductase subunit H